MLLAVYGVVVLLVATWPSPVDAGSRGVLIRLLRALHRHGVPGFVNYDFVEFTANIAMFVPLGALIALLLGPRRWWGAVFVCAGLTIAIEFYQYLVLPARYATVQDVVANSLGGAIGTLIAVVAIARLRSTDPPALEHHAAPMRQRPTHSKQE